MSNGISRTDPADDYELLQRVGHGTYGEVYKAKKIRDGTLAAIKVVKIEAGDNFSVVQQEIVVLSECVHPNIISYYGSYLRRERLWIVMEYCTGGSLQDIYHMTGPLTELQIAFVCRETLKGLEYLHAKGKIHRDIKGANILLSHSGDIKLADFGVAAQITATIGKRKSFIGTPYWMAPEVANVEQKGGYGAECDVWAVGITSIELAELQPPMFDLHPMQVLRILTKSSFKSPKLKDKRKWSPMFHDFVKSCLVKNPKKRPTPSKLLQLEINQGIAGQSQQSRFKGRDPDTEGLNYETESSHGDYQSRRTIPAKELCTLAQEEDSEEETDNELLHSPPSTSSASTAGELPPPSFPQRVRRQTDSSNRDASPGVNLPLDVIPVVGARFKSDRSASLEPSHLLSSREHPRWRACKLDGQTPLAARPTTCYGLVPTPQVSMGACFFNILHDCALQVNCVANWIHPANHKQYLFLGAEEGIFTLNLTELHEDNLTQVHDRRCGWLHVIGDVMTAQQGKTSYLYRHDILQLLSQQLIVQKCNKKITKLPEKLKPRLLQATIRLPETKDVYQCNLEKSVLNGNTYMCCAVPNAIQLFQWFEPRASFIFLKSVPVENLPRPQIRPFHLVFGGGALNADYPQVCIGVYKTGHTPAKDVTLTPESSIEKEVGNEMFHFRLVDFNDNGRLEDFVAKSWNADLYATLKPLGQGKILTYGNRPLCDVVSFKQLDRDTIFLAYGNRVVITDLDGSLKTTDLMQTQFEFEFPLVQALPLADSVLAFHKHGVEGRSFFNGAKTQDLCDNSKTYDVLGTGSMIVLRATPLERRFPMPATPQNSTKSFISLVSTITASAASTPDRNPVDPFDICVLTGHVSTLTVP